MEIERVLEVFVDDGVGRLRGAQTVEIDTLVFVGVAELLAFGRTFVGAVVETDRFIFTYEKDAVNHAYIYRRDGTQVREIELPGLGSAAFSSCRDTPEVFYSFASFTSPSTIYSYDADSGLSTELSAPELAGFNPDDYETSQVFYPSADGTMIPMFITHRKGIELNGKNPTLLYGYGGFNVSLNPGFNAMRLIWLENGGIYVSANLRGGGEYGEEWHRAGMQMNKLNVFNDFIAAAEWLIANGYTSPEHLAIMGGSNGGLLVGATVNMRPDLFSVAIPQVGVMDMMRYHLFTIGWNWAPDYGTSADSPEMAEYLLKYSPLHNISDNGTPYPAILVTTADHDDRVVPAHCDPWSTFYSGETSRQGRERHKRRRCRDEKVSFIQHQSLFRGFYAEIVEDE